MDMVLHSTRGSARFFRLSLAVLIQAKVLKVVKKLRIRFRASCPFISGSMHSNKDGSPAYGSRSRGTQHTRRLADIPRGVRMRFALSVSLVRRSCITFPRFPNDARE
jgi:hypothetical protein